MDESINSNSICIRDISFLLHDLLVKVNVNILVKKGSENYMIEKIIQALVVAVVLYVVWFLVSLVLSPLLPAVVLTVIGAVLVLVFCAYLLRLFGITI